MKLVTIIIPIYKSILEVNELKSLNQCLKVLGDYPVIFVCPYSLDLSNYISIFSEQGRTAIFEKFNDKYFDGIEGYNQMMLSTNFYRRFEKFKFMLIYQLDAWVFRNEIEYWCQQSYDYVGAPWVIEMKVDGVKKLMFQNAGNGGFSLRNVKAQIKVLYHFSYVIKPNELIKKYKEGIKGMGYKTRIKDLWKLFMHLTIKNNSFFLFNQNDYFYEDDFWVRCGNNFKWYRVANVAESMKFSFENYPSFVFEQNNQEIPFGCHAWQKHEYDIFYRKFIDC